MKATIAFSLAFVVLAVFAGCKQHDKEELAQVLEMEAKPNTSDDLKVLKARIDELEAKVAALTPQAEAETLESEEPNDPSALLQILDQDLDAVEQGGDPRGSFTDYFCPTLAKALEAGASRKQVDARINRLIQLADEDKFLSSYQINLWEKGGSEAVLAHVHSWIEE